MNCIYTYIHRHRPTVYTIIYALLALEWQKKFFSHWPEHSQIIVCIILLVATWAVFYSDNTGGWLLPCMHTANSMLYHKANCSAKLKQRFIIHIPCRFDDYLILWIWSGSRPLCGTVTFLKMNALTVRNHRTTCSLRKSTGHHSLKLRLFVPDFVSHNCRGLIARGETPCPLYTLVLLHRSFNCTAKTSVLF